ncbi:kinase-like domain-containing protein [Dioszegia hungarica]|uniref:Kinase-like domain-containing protein n=1 Tax=Dioszegia hungarica TaxID=4972 RepID=A0AA38HAJ9_9TREE|nr:kinase-like domain-containing protein [Dioszegia hungarica]KAI9637038.1 kinase-like domain-containing protein [Dioszegia hungarica]
MPRTMQTARRPANYVATPTSTVQTVSSTSGSRRKSGASASGKGMGWTMEQTYDSTGARKEIIVIEDSNTPDHIPRKRTRAMAAAEAAAEEADKQTSSKVNGSVASSVAAGGSGKKRKIAESSETAASKKAKAKAATSQSSYAAPVVQAKAPAPVQAPAGTHPPWDDAEGHYIVKPDDVIGGRYKIVRLLGQGTFGKVVEARHIESRRKVAIKIIRAVQKYRDASKIEIRVLETLRKHDARNDNKCIHLEEYFDFRSHPCLVSELYGMSVFDFLKQNGFQPFPEKHIQDFAKSLLRSVQFLHQLKLVHTDLKPENILLVGNDAIQIGDRTKNAKTKRILRNTDIRLIDFGSATFEDEYHSSVVSTRHYRAPEIILGMNWSYPCDIYSIGCILVEFFTGDALFQTHDNLEHLAMMEVVMGKMSTRMVDKGKQKKPEFFRGNKVDYPNPSVSKSSRRFVKGLKSLKDIIAPNSQHNKLFLDLIVRMLDFDPEMRITVSQALNHPYIRAHIPDPEP